MSASRIHCLDTHVIDHIAAGEVVERPAAVVKELLENAYDAGAHHVDIQLERGGLQRMTVTDDGSGMSADDAQRCILRHATSKIETIEDLACVQTLGFRGEALSSIAAVSKMTLTTRPKDALEGFQLTVHAGQIVASRIVGSPVGTSVDVRDLFYNTPARQKFMRAPATEQAHVIEAVQRVALGRFEGECIVSTQHRRLIDIPSPKGQPIDEHVLQKRIGFILGNKLGKLSFVASENEIGRLQGFVSEPQLSRTETKGMWIFVNGRFVRDRMLQRAVLDTYKMHQPHRYPTVILWLDVDPQALDVNVHPQKLEVRFSDAHLVYQLISAAVAQSIGKTPFQSKPMLPQQHAHASQGLWQASEGMTQSLSVKQIDAYDVTHHAPRVRTSTAAAKLSLVSSKKPKIDDKYLSKIELHEMRAHLMSQPSQKSIPEAIDTGTDLHFLGRLGARFVLATQAEAFWLLDWQKLLQLQLVKSVLDSMQTHGQLEKKQLLLPPLFEAEIVDIPMIEANIRLWDAFGVELDPIGSQQFCVRSIPKVLEESDPVSVVQALVYACRQKKHQELSLRAEDVQHDVLDEWKSLLEPAPQDAVHGARRLSKILFSLRCAKVMGLDKAMRQLNEVDADLLFSSSVGQ